ncbi:hypothetical protein SO694_00002859 [Aureococcus anophagefferens]|uniref:Uncharacterized protein n=1 Tax=Aureococcus anophagefferens TaxID=44056 RepID=A0ABR1GCS4_AURAN
MGEDDARFEAGPSPEAWTTGLLDHGDGVGSGAVERPSLGLRPRVLAGLRDAGAVVELESRLRAWLVHANGGDERLVLSRVPFQAPARRGRADLGRQRAGPRRRRRLRVARRRRPVRAAAVALARRFW